MLYLSPNVRVRRLKTRLRSRLVSLLVLHVLRIRELLLVLLPVLRIPTCILVLGVLLICKQVVFAAECVLCSG